jgi:hypothetical protein
LAAAFSLAGPPAQAQVVKPFKVTGAGTVDYVPIVPFVPVTHDATGQATELGRYYGIGQVQLLGFTGPATANFDSAVPFVFIAANGDQLAFTYGDTTNGAAAPGQVTLSPVDGGLFVAVWVAEFNPVPALCTGRFAKVTGGSFIMTAVTEPFVLGGTYPVRYSWSGDGTLIYAKGH